MRSSSRGFTLMWALILMVAVGTLSSVTVSRMAAMRGAAATDEADVRAVLAADGAIATARVMLAADPTWTGDRVSIGGFDVATTVVTAERGWTVTARAGGGVVLAVSLLRDDTGRPRIASWRRAR